MIVRLLEDWAFRLLFFPISGAVAHDYCGICFERPDTPLVTQRRRDYSSTVLVGVNVL